MKYYMIKSSNGRNKIYGEGKNDYLYYYNMEKGIWVLSCILKVLLNLEECGRYFIKISEEELFNEIL